MNGKRFGLDQRDYIRFRESDSFDDLRETDGSFSNSDRHEKPMRRNRYGEQRARPDHYQDDQYRRNYDPTYEDELGMRHPYEHGGRLNRWSDDYRSEASHENHSGKGPKGYKRSPSRIIEEANEILAGNWDLDASDIEVSFEEGSLYLKGEVTSRHDKRMAESLIESISGVEDVINQLNVKKKPEGWIPGLGNITSHEKNQGEGHG
jgi:hypothetical protein